MTLTKEVWRLVRERFEMRVLIVGVWALCHLRFILGRERAGVMASRWIDAFARRWA